MKHIGAEVYKWQIPEEEAWIKEYYNDTYYPKGELVIVKDLLKTDSKYRLAYKFDIYANRPMSRNYVWVDAITGEVINMESRIHFSNATGTAATRYSGTRTITTDSYNGGFRLRETRNGVNISTFNMNHTGNHTSTDFIDNNNNWTAAEFHNANNDDAALDAHWGAEMVYEYFKQPLVHNRNSWNGNGGPLLSYVNGDLVLLDPQKFNDSDNALWDGNKMTYGQGTTWPPVVALDICAHEIGHGICESTANLAYQGESGAINESLSDIWGACVENWATTDKQTWLIGEDLGVTIRNMSNPNLFGDPDTYQGDNWYTGSNASTYVHRNSGVSNFWFFLLSQGGTGTNDLGNAYNVTGIGIDKAAKIVYKAETSYLTSSANYVQFRNATIQAATNLYGNNSQEVVSVTNAWYAVGVGAMHPPIIVGPSFVCPGTTGVFTANYALANVGVTWSCSNPSAITPNGNPATVTNNTSLNNSGMSFVPFVIPPIVNYYPEWWIHAELAGTGITLEKTITVNTNRVEDFDLPATASANTILIVTATTAVPGIVNWSVTPSTGVNWQQWMNNSMQITFSQSGLYTVQASTTTACGTFTKEKQITISGGCSTCPPIQLYVIAYPNPSSDLLNIEVREEIKGESSRVMSKERKPVFLYQLFDEKGNSVLRTETSDKKIQFNTSKLSNGIYFIHLQDISSKDSGTAKQTVIIKH